MVKDRFMETGIRICLKSKIQAELLYFYSSLFVVLLLDLSKSIAYTVH